MSVVGGYLKGFTTALSRQAHFKKWYIDAFAGTGERTVKLAGRDATLFEPSISARVERRAGSARIALDTQPRFDRLIFLDTKPRHIAALEHLKADYVRRGIYRPEQISVIKGDANKVLQRATAQPGWDRVRATMFLDPYGMGVEWPTLEAIRSTKAIDLWYLVSLAGLYRQATRRESKLDEKKRAALTRMLGTDEWERAWYARSGTIDLFGPESEESTRTADLNRIEEYVRARLGTVFPEVLPPLRLNNDRGSPMFSLYFAMSNPSPAARKVALPIARYILGSGR